MGEVHRGVQTKVFIQQLNEPWLPPGMLTASPAGPASQLAGRVLLAPEGFCSLATGP